MLRARLLCYIGFVEMKDISKDVKYITVATGISVFCFGPGFYKSTQAACAVFDQVHHYSRVSICGNPTAKLFEFTTDVGSDAFIGNLVR